MKYIGLLSVGFYCSIFLVYSCTENPGQENSTSINSIELIKNDMLLPHEGYPSGLPENMDWAHGPRLAWGNNPPENWKAMIPWGQIYADSSRSPAANTRFQIRNMQTWYLSKSDNTWKRWIITSTIDGANYTEDFQNDVNVPADIRTESDGGGISASLKEGYNFHFWPSSGRVSIDPTDIAGMWSSMESRLIVADLSLPDDRSTAKLMLSAGADYWLSLSAEWDQWKTNGDIGIGRFRYLTPEWQAFNMHSLSEEQLRSNPPPFDQ